MPEYSGADREGRSPGGSPLAVPLVNPGLAGRYNDYTWAGALRVDVPPEVKAKAVAAARSRMGQPFYLLAPKSSNTWFYCTKLVWWSYKQAGIDLDPDGGFWIVPDRFLLSPRVQPVGPTDMLAGGRP